MKPHSAALSGLTASVMLMTSAYARATNSSTTSSGQPLSVAEQQFIRNASGTNLLEVRLGELALERSSNASVKDFAQRMIHDHTQLESKLATVARQNGMQLPAGLNQQGKQEFDKLSALKGRSFDQAYANFNVKGHKQFLSTLHHDEPELTGSLKKWDNVSVPVIRAHLNLAEQTDYAVANEPKSHSGVQTGGSSSNY